MQKLDWTCPENDEERKAEGRLKKEDKKQTQKEDKIRRERIERERERERENAKPPKNPKKE